MKNFIKEILLIALVELTGVVGNIINYDYKQFFTNITNPKWNPNVIVGRALNVAMVTALVFMIFSFINAILN